MLPWLFVALASSGASGNHSWQECTRAGNHPILVRGRQAAARKAAAAGLN